MEKYHYKFIIYQSIDYKEESYYFFFLNDIIKQII